MARGKKHKSRSGRVTRQSMSLVALATVAAYGAFGRADAVAQQAPGEGKKAPVPAQLPVRSYKIVSGSLDEALNEYRAQSGVKVQVQIPMEELATLKSAGVNGLYSNDVALKQVLDGTGLGFKFNGANVVSVGLRASESVDVTTSVAVVNMTQFTQPLLDTAQTVQSVPQFIMGDEQVTSLRDTLRNVPGISIAAGEGGSQGDTLTIRGFNARNDIYLDGIRDFGSYYRDSFNYEAVDVLEGPAGVEFGRGSTGGVVNQESKMPNLGEHVGGTMQLGTNEMRRVTADVNEPLQGLGGSAFRVNLAGEESNVAGRNYTNVRRFGVAPSLAAGLNGPTRALLTYLHEGENDLPDYGLPYFGAGPLNVNRNNYYGFLEGDYFRTNPDVITGRVEHDFGRYVTVHNALRFANYPRDVNITEPQINTVPVYNITGSVTQTGSTYRLNPGSTVTGSCLATAATPCYALNTPLSALTVRRNQIQVKSVEDMLWDQASATAHVNVHGIVNDFLVILEGGRERSRPQRLTFPSNIYANALNPNANDIIPAATSLGAKTYVNAQSYGMSFMDTLKLREWLQLSGGVRFDYFNADYVVAPSTHLSRLDKQPDYRAAIVVKPRPEGSVYFDYGTSFNPSAESLSLSATNAVQPPQYNETYESGAKWDFLKDRLNLNGSWFQTTKTNVYETDPTNSLNVIPVGNQRVRGAQIGGLGHLPQHFDLIFGYAYLSGTTIGTIANYSPFASVTAYVNGSPTALTAVNLYIPGDPVYGQYPYNLQAKGNPFANVPKNTANLFVTHGLWKGFVGGFGFNEVGARRASSTGPIALPQSSAVYTPTQLPLAFKVLPGYWTYSAMLKRSLSEHVTFQANVNNLTNAFYIDQPHPNHLIPSEGINAQFGFAYVWSGHRTN